MKVAFDVQGTLIGHNADAVVRFFRFLQTRGHEMYVWSFGGAPMARDAIKRCGLFKTMAMAKITRPRETDMDVAIDDESDAAQVLSVGKVILVHQIPADEKKFEALAKEYGL